MKSIILARVSENDQKTEQQTVRLVEYRDRRQDLEKWLEFEFDESSTTDKRAKFEQVINEVKKSKEPVALIVDTVDRLQRTFKESPMLDDLRKSGKLELHFIREGLVLNNNSNSADLLRWDMGVLFARSYVLQLSDNVKRKREQQLRNGQWPGKAKMGYINVTLPDGRKDLIIDEERAPKMLKLFEMYSTGNYSYGSLIPVAKKIGLVNNTDLRKPLVNSQIEAMLKDPFYYGLLICNGKTYGRHRYPSIVDKWLFDKCESVIASRRHRRFKYRSKPFAFRDLIKCSTCGCTISPDIQKEDRYVYMFCSHYKGGCGQEPVNQDIILEQVKDILRTIQIPREAIDRVYADIDKHFSNEQRYNKDSIQDLRKEYDKIQEGIKVMYRDRRVGRITSDEYDRYVKEEKQKQIDLEIQMGDHTKADKEFLMTVSYLLELSNRAVELFEHSKPEQRRQLLNFVLSNCKLEGKKLLFELKTPFDVIAECSRNRTWLPLSIIFRTKYYQAICNLCPDISLLREELNLGKLATA